MDITNVTQPIVDESMPLVVNRCLDPAASVVTAHDHVLNLKYFHSVVKNGEAIDVRMNDKIGHIAMDEDFPGKQPYDLVSRNATVGTADP